MKNFTLLGLLLSTFFSSVIIAQDVHNDCVNAISINSDELANQTFNVYEGPGNSPNEINSCGGNENNTLWLHVTMMGTGTFGFDLIPLNSALTEDFDFWVFVGNSCDNLGNPIRCATTNPVQAGLTTNHTGINGQSFLTQTGPGANGTGYVHWLDVQEGESYYIAIDGEYNDSDTGKNNESSGFTIHPTGTSVTLGTQEEIKINNSIKIFPNPAKNHFTIDCSEALDVNGWSVDIINVLGQIVYSSYMDNQQLEVSSNKLGSHGVYFVKVQDKSNNLVFIKRLIIK